MLSRSPEKVGREDGRNLNRELRARRERVRSMKMMMEVKRARTKMSTLMIMTIRMMMIHSAMYSMIKMILMIIMSSQLHKSIRRPSTQLKTLFWRLQGIR
jgi:hypothetical protein